MTMAPCTMTTLTALTTSGWPGGNGDGERNRGARGARTLASVWDGGEVLRDDDAGGVIRRSGMGMVTKFCATALVKSVWLNDETLAR